MKFQYDPIKSESNKEKHGIDFEEAKELWSDSYGVVFPAKSDDEPRFALMAELNKKIWVAFYTIRDEDIRLISVRRARKGESEVYESKRFG
tara:strand:+ start:1985 stop:2257 length:273 start_codon:yes stop_codon:yes gene_type:complete